MRQVCSAPTSGSSGPPRAPKLADTDRRRKDGRVAAMRRKCCAISQGITTILLVATNLAGLGCGCAEALEQGSAAGSLGHGSLALATDRRMDPPQSSESVADLQDSHKCQEPPCLAVTVSLSLSNEGLDTRLNDFRGRIHRSISRAIGIPRSALDIVSAPGPRYKGRRQGSTAIVGRITGLSSAGADWVSERAKQADFGRFLFDEDIEVEVLNSSVEVFEFEPQESSFKGYYFSVLAILLLPGLCFAFFVRKKRRKAAEAQRLSEHTASVHGALVVPTAVSVPLQQSAVVGSPYLPPAPRQAPVALSASATVPDEPSLPQPCVPAAPVGMQGETEQRNGVHHHDLRDIPVSAYAPGMPSDRSNPAPVVIQVPLASRLLPTSAGPTSGSAEPSWRSAEPTGGRSVAPSRGSAELMPDAA